MRHQFLDLSTTHGFETNQLFLPDGAVKCIDCQINVKTFRKNGVSLRLLKSLANRFDARGIDHFFHALVKIRVPVRLGQCTDSGLATICSNTSAESISSMEIIASANFIEEESETVDDGEQVRVIV